MKTICTLNDVLEHVAQTCAERGDFSPTTIRTMVNDQIDYLEKAGCANAARWVRDGYDQERAIKLVRKWGRVTA